MSESIAEMVIPGTYIEVRAEGLIGVGGILTGNLGIVGTAARGPVNAVRTVSSLTEVLDLYGHPDDLGSPRVQDQPLTLVRTLQKAFDGGARTVLAVRIANGTPQAAGLTLRTAGGQAAFPLAAAGVTDAEGARVAGSSGTWGREIAVQVAQDSSSGSPRWRLTLTYRTQREVHEGPDIGAVHASLAASRFVTAGELASGAASAAFEPVATTLQGGTDGADAAVSDVTAGLAVLEEQPVNILLVAGFGADRVGNAVLGHLQRTENEGRERIAVLGARSPGTASDAGPVLQDVGAVSDDRVVLVAPGLLEGRRSLPPSYLAAAVAGRLATLAPHVSLTNKALPVTLDVRYSTGVTSTLVSRHVLVVRQKFGAQVVRGITTSPPPFEQIAVRRTVDYAKEGVRRGADPYIGRLNNARVRAALQATLDGFLSQMVLDEMLVAYQLAVSATRAQEIAGVCAVVMTLQPTFSMDYVRVTMTLA